MERISFNYACSVVAIKFPLGQKPTALIVDYNEKEKIEQRIPAGTVQLIDIAKTIEWYLDKSPDIDPRNPILWLPSTIMDYDKKFKSELPLYGTRHQKNMLLESYLSKILQGLLFCNLSNEDLQTIFLKSKMITLQREIEEETDAFQFGEFILASNSMVGDHERICYVTIDVDAPDYYSGSGDSDIKCSYWVELEKLGIIISPKHLNYLLSALRRAVDTRIHPRYEELEILCTASNH